MQNITLSCVQNTGLPVAVLYLRVVNLDGARLALAVKTEEHLSRGLREVQRHIQRAYDSRISVR